MKTIGATSYKQTRFGIMPRAKLIPLEIEGIKKAWDFVLLKNRQGKILINPLFIKQIHKIGFGWIFPEMGSEFRKIDVQASAHLAPKFYLIPELISEYCKDLSVRIKYLPKIKENDFIDKLVSLLAWAHHKFLWIHPFKDYNGRIGRLLINAILLNLNLPPIELKIETLSGRKRYIKALQSADKQDYNKLEKIIKLALEEAGASPADYL